MSNFCISNDFSNKLNIFISSAMNDENGFSWRNMRRTVKKRINECPIFNAFIIEEHCSPIPSSQLFENYVSRADIVILFLKDTVRQGTLQEFDIVKKERKKLMTYFIKSDCTELSVFAIKDEIRNLDYCSYYDYDFSLDDEIENTVLKHLMENLVDWYRFGKMPKKETFTLANVSSYSPSLPKLILENFNSCYGETFKILNIWNNKSKNKEKTKLHDVGISMLNWLLSGINFPTDDEIVKIFLTMKDLFNDTLWLSKRWEACKCMAKNKYELALIYEKEALELAEKGNIPKWIITDILIDCRNIANTVCPFSGEEYQNKLSETNELVYFPGLDRFCSNLFNETIDEYQREFLKSKYETRLGSNLDYIITEFENCLFISMLYGSYTHIVLSREALAKVLYHYGCIYSGENFTFIAAKLQILCENSNELEKIIENEWETIGNELVTNADDLLTLVMRCSNNYIILTVIKKLIVYLSEKSIILARDYLMGLSQKIDYKELNKFFQTIKSASQVISGEDIVVILTNLLKKNIILDYSGFTSVIIGLDISNVSDEILYGFCDLIKINAEIIVQNQGNPQYISALVKQRRDIFICLRNVPNNGLVNDEIIFFEINTDDSFDDVEKVRYLLRNQIEDIVNQMQVNFQNNHYSLFVTNPFLTIQRTLKKQFCKFKDITEVINEKLIPICIQILKNNKVIPLTEECIECLICIVNEYKNNDLQIPNELIDYFNSGEIYRDESEHIFFLFNNGTSNRIKYRYLMLKMLCRIDVREELYYNYLNFSNQSELERVAISECLKEYFNMSDVYDPILISLAFLLSNDSLSDVRVNACSCLYKITSNEYYSNLSYLKLRELSSDVYPSVRKELLNIYINNYEAQKDENYRDIIFNLRKDAHYCIRKRATEMLKKI